MTRQRLSLLAPATLALPLLATLLPAPAHAATTHIMARTPSALGPPTPQNLALSDGTLGSLTVFNTWQETSVGVYTITFPGLSDVLTSPTLVHVSPIGSTLVTCSTDLPVTSGPDMKVTVRCRDLIGIATRSRFALSIRAESSTIPGATMGFFRTALGTRSWTSDGSTPVFSHPSTGSFSVRFPTFRSTSENSGNVQVTSTTVGRRCSIASWGISQFFGTTVSIRCVGAGGTAADADFYVSYGKRPMLAGDGFANFLRVGSPSTPGTQTPSTAFQFLPTSGTFATVTRKSTGRYVVALPPPSSNELPPQYAHDMTGVVTPVNAPGNTCVFLDWDSRTATLQCVDANGAAADTQFTLAMSSSSFSSPSSSNAFDAPQISSKNFNTVADAGYGIACGVTVTAPVGQVQCILGTAAPVSASSTVVAVAPAVTTPGAKALAIDNGEAGFTRILLLGGDDVVYAATGNLLSPFGTTGNFDAYSVYASPFNPIGSRLSFRTIASVRNGGPGISTTIVGLTTVGSLFELEARSGGTWQWVGARYPIPAGVPLATISHGLTDLYLLANDGRMFRSERFAAAATQLPALPDGLFPTAMGGAFVRTNAGISSNCSAGFCCTGPDANGQYPCDGDDQRFFQLVGNDTWAPVSIQRPFPPAGIPSQALTSGNPFTSAGFLVDARMFVGDVSGIMAWHYNSRLYYFHHTVF